MKNCIKLVAFDLDGTVTQHKTPLEERNKKLLDALGTAYKLLMVGAGGCQRIFKQMGKYPIDIIGNYGLQYGKYNADSGELDIVCDISLPCDRESVDKRITILRKEFGFTDFCGENTEFHKSGCVTFPLLGTAAPLEDKLAFDPDRSHRRAIHDRVKEMFPDYTVFIGGTSSFDMAPMPYDKAYTLSKYCAEHQIKHSEVVYVGDDWGKGGNDESVFLSDFNFVQIDDYRTLKEKLKFLL